MNDSRLNNNMLPISTNEIEYFKFPEESDQYILTLVDTEGLNVIIGYGKSIVEAMSDLRHNLT